MSSVNALCCCHEVGQALRGLGLEGSMRLPSSPDVCAEGHAQLPQAAEPRVLAAQVGCQAAR